jgi:hypothetical protein
MTEGWAVTPIQISRQRTGLEIEVFSPSRYTLECEERPQEHHPCGGLAALSGSWRPLAGAFPIQPRCAAPHYLARLFRLPSIPTRPSSTSPAPPANTCGFEVPADRLREGRRLWLDLGRVRAWRKSSSMAGPKASTGNRPITWTLRHGSRRNQRPRSSGDRHLAQPPARGCQITQWLSPPRRRLARPVGFKPFLTADLKLRASEPLAPSGLLGPVRLHSSRRSLLPY